MTNLDRTPTASNISHVLEPHPQHLVPAKANLHNIHDAAFAPSSLSAQTASNHGNARSDVVNFSLDNPREFLTRYEAAPAEPWTAQARFLRQDQGPPFKKRAVSQTRSERPFSQNVKGVIQQLPRKSDSGYVTSGFPPQSCLSNASYFSNHGSQCLSDEREMIGETTDEVGQEPEQATESSAQRKGSSSIQYQESRAVWTHQFPSSAPKQSACNEDQLQFAFPVRVK